MIVRPAVLCPIDFSDGSRGALRYAAAIAEHFSGHLIVLAVNDLSIVDASDVRFGERWFERQTRQRLEEFVKRSFPGRTPQMPQLTSVVVTGRAASEILEAAARMHGDLIVMSTHGATGPRKKMFGSTTERVLRQTTVPVIVAPAHDPGPESLEDWRRSITTLLVPVDLSHYSERQVQVAHLFAGALDASMVVAHVIEPTRTQAVDSDLATEAELVQRETAARRLEDLARLVPARVKTTTVLSFGDPAHEIARLARTHSVGAVVMGLHDSIGDGPRMGTVTYRLVCEAPVLVVAWPPSRLERGLWFAHQRSAAQMTGSSRRTT